MNRIKVIFLFGLFLKSVLVFSQTQIKEMYLDELLHEVDSSEYARKCKYQLFKCLEYKTDSLKINKLLYKYKFGKLKSFEYNQIRNILMLDSKRKIDPNAVLVIKFTDTLFDFNAKARRAESQFNRMIKAEGLDSLTLANMPDEHKPKHTPYTLKTFKSNRKKWSKKQLKCVEKYEKKYDANIFHVFKYDFGMKNSYSSLKWIKDRGVFKNTFFQIIYSSNLLIIKPDGEYFLSGSHFSDKSLGLIIKSPDWTRFKADWIASKDRHIFEGKGIFKKGDFRNHKNHCF